MISQSCLHIRQAFTSWQLSIPTEYSYYLPMPHHVQSKRATPYLAGELEAFKGSIEKWTGRKITNKELDSGINIMNENRRLLKQIYELRKSPEPPITGLEAMYLAVSSQWIDKRDHTRMMQDSLKELKTRKVKTGPRLMILGSENDDTEFIKMVESCCSTIVIDDHCSGSMYFWNEVVPQENRLTAIADRYVNRPPCPTKDWPERRRIPHILKLAKDYNVAGAILIQQKFCDPHELDIPAIKQHLEKNKVPTLFLELDVTVPIGQFKTRVEAFLEMIGQEDLF
jgi:benzoyl-CoA reductase subunit C